jgi:hypothetical protein
MIIKNDTYVLNTKGLEGNFVILLGVAVSLAKGKYTDEQLLQILHEMQLYDYAHMLDILDKYYKNELTIIT